MTLNLTNPQSIAAFYRVHPTRHGQQLAAMAKLWPAFQPQIAQAGDLLRATQPKENHERTRQD